MNGSINDNGPPEWDRRKATILAGLVLATVILVGAWLWVRSAARYREAAVRRDESKLEKVELFIGDNYEMIFGAGTAEEIASPLTDKPLLTIVKELCAQCGLADRLVRVVEEENKKLGELTAKVTFRRVRIADMVNFLTLGRDSYPGLWDREARMRYARGGEADSWDVTLSLTAEKP
ncbi:MAG: hypothetical protein ACYTFG_16785 [Planctomycetota bacterium]|jgi:hypothetical protein